MTVIDLNYILPRTSGCRRQWLEPGQVIPLYGHHHLALSRTIDLVHDRHSLHLHVMNTAKYVTRKYPVTQIINLWQTADIWIIPLAIEHIRNKPARVFIQVDYFKQENNYA